MLRGVWIQMVIGWFFMTEVDLAWFDQTPEPAEGHGDGDRGGEEARVERDRALLAADLDLDPVDGSVRIKGLYS